jgi:4-phytase/acid phosphatase
MMPRTAFRLAVVSFMVLCLFERPGSAQRHAGGAAYTGKQLQFVIYLSRHGVRSPTGKTAQYNQYSAAPWPEWSVPAGYLTPHGYQLMKLFGAFDRAKLAADGLLAPEGCADAARITILADSDQRTRETGKAIAEGMFPGCSIDVHAQAEGTDDPLFHSLHSGVAQADRSHAPRRSRDASAAMRTT